MKPAVAARLRRASCACAALPLLLAVAGCHHKARVSRTYPPPPARRTAPASGTARRPLAPVVIPRGGSSGAADNTIAGGRVASSETGMASWYGPPYSNRKGANGEIYNQDAMTAAHRTLPMGTVVRVTNLSTNQAATVKITDRGPFVRGRIIDLSLAAARETGLYRMGVARVKVEVMQERAGADPAGGRWCVQVGAFLDTNNALRLKADLLRRYSTAARVIDFAGPTGHWVRINPVAADRAHALGIAEGIHAAEPDAQAYLVRLD